MMVANTAEAGSISVPMRFDHGGLLVRAQRLAHDRRVFACAWMPMAVGADRAIQVTSARLDAAIARLDVEAAQVIATSGVPGIAIAVVHDDHVRYLGGFVFANVGKPVRSTQTVFQIARCPSRSLPRSVAGW